MSIDDRARCIHNLTKGLAAGQAEAGYRLDARPKSSQPDGDYNLDYFGVR